MNEETEALAYSQLLLLHADTITDSGVKEMVVNSAAELTILHLRVEALRRENERLREEVRNWKKSFVGHVYVKNEDYAELISKRDALKTENERLREALTYDWDQLEACRESLREHMVEIKRLREALEKIATVNAMDYEYVRWAKAALRREGASDGLSAPSGPACHATDNGAVGAGSRRGATSGPTPE